MLKLHIFTEAPVLLLVLTFNNNIFSYFSWWNCWLDKTSFEVINLVNTGLALHSIFHPVMSNTDTKWTSQLSCEVGILKYYYPHFAAGETEVQKDLVTCPKSGRLWKSCGQKLGVPMFTRCFRQYAGSFGLLINNDICKICTWPPEQAGTNLPCL